MPGQHEAAKSDVCQADTYPGNIKRSFAEPSHVRGASPKRARDKEDQDALSLLEHQEQQRPQHINSQKEEDQQMSERELDVNANRNAFANGTEKETSPPEQGPGKRRRSVTNLEAYCKTMESLESVVVTAEGASPTASIAKHLQVALGAETAEQEAVSRPSDLSAQLTAALRASLSRCIEEGALPSLSYPAPAVVRLKPRKNLQLQADVSFTSAAAHAIAGYASRKATSQSTFASQKLSAEGVAQLLLEHMRLPDSVQGVDISKGHLNFRTTFVPPDADEVHETAAEQRGRQAQDESATIMDASVPRAVPRHFQMTLLRSSDASLTAIEFDLYRRYQVQHHGDISFMVTPSSFRRFLCDSPLIPVSQNDYPAGAAPPCGFGSFHQQYWMDGRLIAVGVIDVLPRSLSSKYLFWDPDLAALSLGRLASLLEIEWVQQMQQFCPSMRYYLLGFYLHSCPRMQYKADFAPSDLLCPKTHCWVPIDRVQSALESGARPPVLAEVPGALEGLTEEHRVSLDGNPTSAPHNPSADELSEVRLLIGSASPPQTRTSGNEHRRGKVISFGSLCSLGLLSEDMKTRLQRRLERWMLMVGPAWHDMVYKL
jgi:arginyl-tRNA--protein-N-Asp/Glu arginylyltransferase